MKTYPHSLYFVNDKCVGAGFCQVPAAAVMHVVNMPSDHYDFIGPVSYRGYTLEEIKKECSRYV